jgi:HD-GYP domain-containing protein (c-di-GMP phosphodiesterase class II)
MTTARVKVLASDVREGMFVEDLDRPWLDTPFLLQGFLVQDEQDLAMLRAYCRHVFVDPSRSTIPVPGAEVMRQASVPRARLVSRCEPALRVVTVAAPGHSTSGAYAVASDGSPSLQKTRTGADRQVISLAARGSASRPGRVDDGVVDSAQPSARASVGTGFRLNPLSRLRELIGDLSTGWGGDDHEDPLPPALRREPPPAEKPDPSLAPRGVELVIYAEPAPIRDELPRAQKSIARARDVLDRLARDMRSSARVDIDGVDEVVNEMVDSMVASPDALMWIARMRQQHSDVYSHGVQVGVYLLALGRHLGFPKAQLGHLGTMGLLLDLGKTAVPRGLLEKPGRLTEQEFTLVKRHVELGLEVLASSARSLHADVIEGIAQHHERLNGGGYPRGLEGEYIGIYGRMAGIADCFAALTSPRPYAETLPVSEAMMRLYDWSGEQFALSLVEKLVQTIGVFPVGSLVELSSGEVAVVIRHNKVRRLQPTVLVIADFEKRPLRHFQTLDLLTAGDGPGTGIRVRRGLPTGAYGLDTDACYVGAA